MSVTLHNGTSPQETNIFLTLKKNETLLEYMFVFSTNNLDENSTATDANSTERTLIKIKLTNDDGQKYGSSYGSSYGSNYGSSYSSGYGSSSYGSSYGTGKHG
jgi:hypothetical protein